jgi:aspartyl-tRNA synthetase
VSEDNNDEKPTLQHIYIYKDLLIQEETMEKTIFPYVKKTHARYFWYGCDKPERRNPLEIKDLL